LGQWWRYEVACNLNHASGYAPGTKANAQKVAAAALRSLMRMEGNVRARAKRRSGHDPELCTCRLCSNERYKMRMFTESLARRHAR
jgi:hypothetical protein